MAAGNAYGELQLQLTLAQRRIDELEAQLERGKPKKRKAIPNPNKAFMTITEIIDTQVADASEASKWRKVVEVDSDESSGESAEEDSEGSEADDIAPPIATRSGRQVSKPSRYRD